MLVLAGTETGSGQAAVTYLREFTQAAWQLSLGRRLPTVRGGGLDATDRHLEG